MRTGRLVSPEKMGYVSNKIGISDDNLLMSDEEEEDEDARPETRESGGSQDPEDKNPTEQINL